MDSNTQGILGYYANEKSTGVAYLLWFFLGCLGAHYFYTGNIGLGSARLLAFATPISFLVFMGAHVGSIVPFLLVLWLVVAELIWRFVEIFFIWSLVKTYNRRVLEKIKQAETA